MGGKDGPVHRDRDVQTSLLTKGEREKASDPNAPKKDQVQFDNINIKLKFKGKNTQSTWTDLWEKLKILSPFLWPRKSAILQVQVLFCFVLVAIGRAVNLFIPLYNKKIVDSLTETSSHPLEFRWDWILIYVVLKTMQGGSGGGMGFLNNLKSFLWIRVQQYTTKEVQVELFRHLHSLSLRWHLNRKTGEVLRIMDRGTESINSLLQMILFNFGPTIIDLLIAIVYFFVAFNYKFGLIVTITMALYLMFTISITEWRSKFRRRMNLADNETRTRSVDSLLNFETVKYYGAEKYEVEAFENAILKYQEEEFKTIITMNMMNSAQNLIANSGLLAGSLLCAYYVVNTDEFNVGDYVLFASYIVQLYAPLNLCGMQYRQIQNNFVDMENMFDLLRQEQEVVNDPNAKELVPNGGRIEFKDVTFKYTPEKTILKNISFNVPPGKTIALVGPSGSGKSTIIKLLFRFYDVDSGSIIVDGYNIKSDVTQQSLRAIIGVVPQDTVLFNQTIKYNIQYGRVSANEAEVIEAAKGADIHNRIMSFAQQYDTMVGERGLRLSGGEKQRVAIARTLLKAPLIILLDEATSALDTHTERNIQESLSKMCVNRTAVIVAHRLSTIINADEILVLMDGEIVERGRHVDLVLKEDGIYAGMWRQQLESNKGVIENGNEKEKGSENAEAPSS
ncbi:ATP-binding cassette sub-family B member 6-like isoform X1 [Euwallacea similis]|uniref:ATP-binding cassette sub-family B member 6-like isoform X1 n=2 Tax=Euwallacea similis TaxID=1736056 RepID=UPI0034509427